MQHPLACDLFEEGIRGEGRGGISFLDGLLGPSSAGI